MYRLGQLLVKSQDEENQDEGRALLERYTKIEPLWPDIQKVKSETDIAPRNTYALWRMAGFLNLGAEYDTALVWAGRCLSIDPNFVPCLAQMGMICANMGKNDDALRAFERAQKILTNHPDPNVGPDPEIHGYIEMLKHNPEDLPLPLGRLIRPEKKAEGKKAEGK